MTQHIPPPVPPPSRFQSVLAEIQRLLTGQDWECALIRLEELPAAFADRPAVLVCRARAHAGLGQIGAAHAALDKAEAALGERIGLLALRRRLQVHTQDLEGLRQTLRRMIALAPERSDLMLELSRFELRLGHAGKAETAARAALRLDPGSPAAFAALYAAVRESVDVTRLPGIVRDSLSVATARPPFRGLHTLFNSLPRSESAALREALERRWPETTSTEGVGAGGYGPQEVPRQAVRLVQAGEVEAALRLTGALRQTPKKDVHLARFEEIAPSIPGPEQRRRAVIRDDDAEMTISAPSTRGVTAVVFTGIGGQAGTEIALVDAFCARADVAGVYLRDRSNRLFLGGINALGADYASTVSALQEVLRQLGTRRLLVFGASGGGVAAIRYGIELRADRIIGLATPTSGDSERLARIGDTRVRLLVQRLSAAFEPTDMDLRPHVAGADLREGLELWYGAEHALDAAHAAHLADLPGVSLHPIAGATRHDVLPLLIGSGAFDALLQEDTAERAPPRAAAVGAPWA